MIDVDRCVSSKGKVLVRKIFCSIVVYHLWVMYVFLIVNFAITYV